jgi:hypothetical protein
VQPDLVDHRLCVLAPVVPVRLEGERALLGESLLAARDAAEVERTLPISRIAERRFTPVIASASAIRSGGIREFDSTGFPSVPCGRGSREAGGEGAEPDAPPETRGGTYNPSSVPGRVVGLSPVGSGIDAFRVASEYGALIGARSTAGPGASVNCLGF